MTALMISAALLGAIVHVLFFLVESVWFGKPKVYRLFVASAQEAEVLRPMAFNQGFYNLFLAAGAIAGVTATLSGADVVGRTLVIFACACMALAGVVLLVTDRKFLRGSLIQAVPALIAIASAAAG